MKELKQKLIKFYKSPMGYSLLLSLVFLFVGVAIFRPFFEESDDMAISLISEGAYGYRDYHLVYVNVILGKFITGLSLAMPMIRWHMVIQYVFIFLIMCCLCMFLSHFKSGRIAAFILQLGCFYELYVSCQYTKVVTFIAAASMVVVLFYLKDRSVNEEIISFSRAKALQVPFKKWEIRLLLIFSYVALIYAILLRDSAFLIAVVFVGVLVVVQLFDIIKRFGIKKLSIYALYVLPVFAFLFVAMSINAHFYNNDEEWIYFNRFNKARTGVVDYRYDSLDYSRHGEALSNEGISENDAYMYVTWQFADKKVVSPELFDKMVELAGNRPIDVDLIKAFVANVHESFFIFSSTLILFFVLTGIWIYRTRFGSAAFFTAIFEAGLSLLVMLYYHYSGRWNHRLVLSLVIALIVIFLVVLIMEDDSFFSSPARKARSFELSKFLTVSAMIILVAVIGHRLDNEFQYQDYLRSGQDFKSLTNYLNDNEDKLFVADTFTAMNRYKYDVFSPVKVGELDNFLTTGGWISASPITNRIAEKYGYVDAFDALYHKADNVILIDNHCPERKIIYLTEHGDSDYCLEYIDNIYGYNLYHIQ